MVLYSSGSFNFDLIPKGSVFNTAVSANTNIFASSLEPTEPATTFRIYAVFGAVGLLTVRRTSGGVTVSEELNGGTNLAANAAYMFDVLVGEGDSINIWFGAPTTCIGLKVVEVPGAVS